MSIQLSHHGGHNPAFLNKVDLAPEEGGGVAVKTHNEAALYLASGSLYSFDAFDQVTVFILLFVALRNFLLEFIQ